MTKTLTIKTTEITWRHKMENGYSVIVVADGQLDWKKGFDNAVDAVNCYNKFIDHGTSISERVVTLVEPNGKLHTKIFRQPELVGLK
jgi:hypothetical protein